MGDEALIVKEEKMLFKKELDRLTFDHRMLQKESKEQRDNYNLLMDENMKIQKQNAEYRGLILNNE